MFSQRALHPPEVKHERLFIVSVLGFFVNLIGIFVFHHGSAAGKHVVIDSVLVISCEKIFTSERETARDESDVVLFNPYN